MTTAEPLTDVEREILELERSWWKYPGAKETHLLQRFGFGETRYYQVLSALINRPEAEAHDALTVRRLRRLRDARLQQRTARRGSAQGV